MRPHFRQATHGRTSQALRRSGGIPEATVPIDARELEVSQGLTESRQCYVASVGSASGGASLELSTGDTDAFERGAADRLGFAGATSGTKTTESSLPWEFGSYAWATQSFSQCVPSIK